jgi:hypothetical protein
MRDQTYVSLAALTSGTSRLAHRPLPFSLTPFRLHRTLAALIMVLIRK